MDNGHPSGTSSSAVNGNAPAPPTESYVPPPSSSSTTTSSSSAPPATKHSRVTSTVAQSFAADLDSMFGLSASGARGGGGPAAAADVDLLSQNVEEKYVCPLLPSPNEREDKTTPN